MCVQWYCVLVKGDLGDPKYKVHTYKSNFTNRLNQRIRDVIEKINVFKCFF